MQGLSCRAAMILCITHSGVMGQAVWCVCVCVFECVGPKRDINSETENQLGVDECVCVCDSLCIHVCVHLCVNWAGGHHWQSLAPRMCLNREGLLLMEGLSLCFPHLRVHTNLHRRPLHSALWQDIQSHHTGTLFLSNTRASGLSHHGSGSKPRGRMGEGQRGV